MEVTDNYSKFSFTITQVNCFEPWFTIHHTGNWMNWAFGTLPFSYHITNRHSSLVNFVLTKHENIVDEEEEETSNVDEERESLFLQVSLHFFFTPRPREGKCPLLLSGFCPKI